MQLQSGEVLALLGPNGAGKTTLLKMVCGLLEPDRGSIERAAVRERVGYAPQHLLVWPELTAREQLVFMARMYGRSSAEAGARADGLLDALGLQDKGGELARRLSGGMQRRLNIGLSLVHEPPLLILDEPTVGLDPTNRRRVHELLTGLQETTVLWSTHDVDEADRMSDRVAIMDRGRIVRVDTAEALRSGAETHDASLEDAFLQLTGRRLS